MRPNLDDMKVQTPCEAQRVIPGCVRVKESLIDAITEELHMYMRSDKYRDENAPVCMNGQFVRERGNVRETLRASLKEYVGFRIAARGYQIDVENTPLVCVEGRFDMNNKLTKAVAEAYQKGTDNKITREVTRHISCKVGEMLDRVHLVDTHQRDTSHINI